MSLRDVAFALALQPNESDLRPWRLRRCLAGGIWPPLEGDAKGITSVRELLRRFAAAGRELRELAAETNDAWTHISHPMVVDEIRLRLRDPAIMRQNPTDYCGAYCILVEFARRNPARYVKQAAELLRTGSFTTRTGKILRSSPQLRNAPLPKAIQMDFEAGKFDTFETPAMVDWMFASTMRQGEETEDLLGGKADFDGQGLEGLTLPHVIEWWSTHILGLKSEVINCFSSGELSAIRRGQLAIAQDGIAILLVDTNLLKKGDISSEEQVQWSQRWHFPGEPREEHFSGRVKSKDDDLPPDHYVLMLGHLEGAGMGDKNFRVRLWSYGREYEVTGEADGFGEYLYWVITGIPS